MTAPLVLSPQMQAFLMHEFVTPALQVFDENTPEGKFEIMNHLQEAYWFIIDIMKTPLTFSRFLHIMFPHMGWPVETIPQTLRKFKQTNRQKTRAGGILLNPKCSHVLLVRGHGAKFFSFPVGKQIQHEPLTQTATREIFEETGYDVKHNIEPQHCIVTKLQKHQKPTFLFLCYDVPFHFRFQPQTRLEIAELKWVHVQDLLHYMKSTRPFLQPLLQAIRQRKKHHQHHPT